MLNQLYSSKVLLHIQPMFPLLKCKTVAAYPAPESVEIAFLLQLKFCEAVPTNPSTIPWRHA